MSKKPIDPHAPTEPAMPAVQGPSSSGEHQAVKQFREELERGHDLAAKIERGEVPQSPTPPPPDTPVTLRPEHLDAMVARQENVLIIEDDQDIRDTLADILRDAGYSVRTAADGVDGLGKITDKIRQPDLVILDLGLPRLSGKAVAAAMNADDIRIPRLIISAGGNVDRLLKQHPELEGEFVFPKPLNLEGFLAKVAQRIKEYRSMPRIPF